MKTAFRESLESHGEPLVRGAFPTPTVACDRFENRSVTLSHTNHAGSPDVRSPLNIFLWLSLSLAVIVGSTWIAFHFRLNLATMGFLYLILVIASAMRGGFWFATVISVASALCLNYFFAPPLFSFSISDPANWVALGAFEMTALVISRLSDKANDRTAEAIRERRDAERLYQVSLRIFLLNRSRDPGNTLAAVIRESFDLKTVVMFDAVSGNTYSAEDSAGEDHSAVVQRARRAFLQDTSEFEPALESWFCVLRLDSRPVGGLALCGRVVRPLIATALASLCATSFDRFRSFEREYRAEAGRHAEELRAAVLDSLAHQIKTPVATISAASSGLIALGGLSETQATLMSVLDEQSKKLAEIAPQLLKTAKLDSSALAPRRELLQLSDVVDETIHLLDPQRSGKRLRVSCPNEEMPVLGDRKLISAALVQIVDNAFKYSAPGTPIDIRVQAGRQETTISVQNEGPSIQASDRERIFERFYRARPAQEGPSGSGLGLSIVRRIVEAHAGRVWFESQAGVTMFFLALPLAPSGDVMAATNGRE
jgi:two-component system, OmpR family, sensor histidine kinase KdpD